MEAAEPNKRWLPESDYSMCMEVAASARQHPLLLEMLYHPASKTEHTGYFEIEGTPCKVRPDLYNSENGMVIDLKTTMDASEKGFAKSVRQFGYAFQAAFYMTALRQMGEQPKQFVFLVVEKSEPYATACYHIDNNDIEREVPRVLEAIKIYGECLRTDVWPGYSDDIKTLNLGTPFTENRLSISKTSEKFGVSRSYVYKIIKEYNIETRKIRNRQTISMYEFSNALRWANQRVA
jgi:AraC-like DNA-binding protein